ncbi:lipopolysaccharide biosynthesis protein [Vibrio taketomensis]|uniref:lipopolysaccharide biosynthesis protein n=1 Tax=Vibrio taketomensis TaxID=2572923 RepID=UPI00138A0006|nr:oligosaccharide flippase family protein [Vibrio taketomensis]
MIGGLARNSALNSMLLYGIALLCLRGASLITLPVMTYYLSVEQVGRLELISVTQIFFALFVSLAMHENLYRFVAVIDQKHQQKKTTSQLYCSSITLSALIVSLLGAGYLLISHLNTETFAFVAFNFITPIQMVLMASVLVIQGGLEISLAWLRLQNNALAFFKISVFCSVVQVGLILAIVQLYPTVTAVLSVGVFSAFLQLTILHVYNRFELSLLSIEQLKQYLKYCLPIMWSALIAFGLNGGERWLLVKASNVELLAQYAIALKFALAVGILLQPFHMWWMPKRFEYWQNQGAQSATNFTQIGLVYACLLTVVIAWLGKLFIATFLPADYQLATQLISLAVLAMLFKELTELLNIGLLKAKQTQTLLKINLAVTSFALILISMLVWQLPHHTVWVVSFGIVLAQFLRTCVVFICSQRANTLPYHLLSLCLFVAITTLFAITPWLTDHIGFGAATLCLELLLLLAFAHHYKLVNVPTQKLRNAITRLYI